MHDVLDRMLASSPEPPTFDGIEDWWTQHRATTRALPLSIQRAMLGGFVADRPAYAFVSGYQEALRKLLDGVVLDVGDCKIALCATEEGGNHPRAIKTTLSPTSGGYLLDGHKRWATLGSHADRYIVIASEGQEPDGRNHLTAVYVPAERMGITATPVSDTEQPFVPEIPHVKLAFERVNVAFGECLEGDGYERYLKPFRTIEDCHVYAAMLGWTLQVGRRAGWAEPVIETLVAWLATIHSIATSDPSSPATHIALAGLIAQSSQLLLGSEAEWALVDDQTRARGQRDRTLLQVAGKARTRRREVAWERLRASR